MIRFVQYEEKYIPQMAEILAVRHRAERRQFSFLPERFENTEETEKVLLNTMSKPYSGGLVTLRGEEVIGYLLYEFKQDAARGRYVSIGYPSLAIREDEHPRLVRLMYAEAGAEWIRNHYYEHIIYAPMSNQPIMLELLEQSFRFDRRYALLQLDSYENKGDGTTKVTLREVAEDDYSLLRKMAHWNSIHQATAPSWQPITKETLGKVQKEYAELTENPAVKIWIAEQNSIPAAFHVYHPAATETSMVTPEKTAHLAAAATNTDFRGRGIGKAMADYSFEKIEELGFDFIMADWRTQNYLSSYFWPKLGFQPYMVRMVRTVDARISAADDII